MLLYTLIYASIGVFWLAFGLILHHCSPWQGESPMAPRELHETTKCKHNIILTLQHSVSALHLKTQDNRGGRRECKESTKKLSNYSIMIEKKST